MQKPRRTVARLALQSCAVHIGVVLCCSVLGRAYSTDETISTAAKRTSLISSPNEIFPVVEVLAGMVRSLRKR